MRPSETSIAAVATPRSAMPERDPRRRRLEPRARRGERIGVERRRGRVSAASASAASPSAPDT